MKIQIPLHLNNIRLNGWCIYIGLFITDTVIHQWVIFKEKKEASLLKEMLLYILKELAPLRWDEMREKTYIYREVLSMHKTAYSL